MRGCSKVSEGCRNCYAMKQAHRFSGPGMAYDGLTQLVTGKGPQWTGVVCTVPEVLEVPLRWRKPRRVFVNSMSDLFHEDVPIQFILQVFEVMARCPQHTFQILTKRPERMAYCLTYPPDRLVCESAEHHRLLCTMPLPNVWLGTSVEDQAAADERIPHLLRTPAAVRFLSCEPLLGSLDIRQALTYHRRPGEDFGSGGNYLADLRGVDWIIVGGESGPGARPCHTAWIRSLVEQCRAAGMAVFVKQLGARPISPDGHSFGWSTGQDRKGGDPHEWPNDLRVREFPA